MSIFGTKTAEKTEIQIDCINLNKNRQNNFIFDDIEVTVFHKVHEQIGINRIWIEHKNFGVEILPSKGFSVGKAILQNKSIFWDMPVNLIHPDMLSFESDEIYIKGKKRKGYSGIQNIAGGVELYGLHNWGIPDINHNNGKTIPLHGTISNIPAEHATITITDKNIIASSIIEFRDGIGDDYKVWYDRGEIVYLVHKNIIIDRKDQTLHITDMIENVSEQKHIPDWGYQVNFKPEKGSQVFIPATIIENRGGGKIHKMFNSWSPSPYPNHRVEHSTIFKSMKISPSFFNDNDGIASLIKHPDRTGIAFYHTPAPYLESWISAGGKDSKEYTLSNGQPIMRHNWDTIGIKLGSSPYDHDCNICPDVEYEPVINPGESITTHLLFQLTDRDLTEKMERSINSYNSSRIKIE